jgi:hypothetical protein
MPFSNILEEDLNEEPRHRNVPLVSTYKDVDDDVMDMLMEMEKDEDVVFDEDEEFEVEGIVGHRINPDNGKVEFRVKWDGYDTSKNTWEPLEMLGRNDLVLADIIEWMSNQQRIQVEDIE